MDRHMEGWTDRLTHGWTDRLIPVYTPKNLFCGGIKMLILTANEPCY